MRKVTGFGNHQSQTDFLERHAKFFDCFETLQTVLDEASEGPITGHEPADPVVFYLGNRCVRDFVSIVILAANDHGLSAMALLRHLYERAATMVYLHQNPGKALKFAEYGHIQQYKTAEAVKNAVQLPVHLEAALPELKMQYDKVKPNYIVSDCKKCGTKKLSISWTPLDIYTLSKEIGTLGALAVPAYAMTLLQTHATFASISALVSDDHGNLTYKGAHHEESDHAIEYAHRIVLHVLRVMIERFRLAELTSLAEKAYSDYAVIWGFDPFTTAWYDSGLSAAAELDPSP